MCCASLFPIRALWSHNCNFSVAIAVQYFRNKFHGTYEIVADSRKHFIGLFAAVALAV